MKRVALCLAVASISLASPANAGNGANVAAGVVGGLAVGTLLGAAIAQPRYAAPPPAYVVDEPAPVMVAPPRCYRALSEPVWDGYRGMWVRHRVRVCD